MPVVYWICGYKNEMNADSVVKIRWKDASETEAAYTRLCVPALLAALFGLGAFLVYFTLWLCVVGVIAILLSLVALRVIRNGEGALTGTPLAYFGLCCGIVALVSVAVFWQTYQYGVRREADQFFRLWFTAVQQGDIPKAKEFQSIYAHRSRVASSEEWWKTQYANKYAHRNIHQYTEDKLVRVLMALGDKAKVSYYKTLSIVSDRDNDVVTSVYAVTFPAESGGIETFFVRLGGKRIYPTDSDFKAAGWQLEGVPAFYLPEEFK